MVLAYHSCIQDIEHALGGPLHSSLSAGRIINEAAQHLASMHPWKWLERVPVELSLRGSISLTGATWTEASRTLTKTSAFTNYTYLAGDRIHVTGGTGATVGYYAIESRTSDNAIVLATSIGSGADSVGDTAATIDLPSVALPSDFGSLIDVRQTNGLLTAVQMTDLGSLMGLRTSGLNLGLWTTYVAVAHGAASTPGGPPVPRLEIYPTPSANDVGALTVTYRAGLSPIVGEGSAGTTEQILPIPEWLEFPFRQLVRAMALGYEEGEKMSMAERMSLVMPFFEAPIRRDGEVQHEYGMIEGGCIAQQLSRPGSHFSRSTVAGPA